MSTISVKLHVAKEVRRFAIARNISLAAFHHFVCEKLVPTLKEYKNHLHYVYVDDEEDTVKILLEEEWREALNVAESNDGYITLKITRHGAPTKTPQQEQQQQARFAYACPRFAARCQPQQQQEQQQHCPRYAQFFGCPRFAQQQQACPRYQQEQQQAPQGNPWSTLFQTVLKEMCAQVPKQEAPKQEQQSNEDSVAFDLESILNQVFGKHQQQQQQQEQAKQQPQQAKKQETPAPATTTSVPVQQVVVDAVPSANKKEEVEKAAKQQEQEVATEQIVLEEPVVVAVETKPEPVEQQQVPVVQQQVAEPQQQQQANTPDYQLELNALQSMGFTNAKFNLHLLNHHNGNMAKVIDTLLTIKLE